MASSSLSSAASGSGVLSHCADCQEMTDSQFKCPNCDLAIHSTCGKNVGGNEMFYRLCKQCSSDDQVLAKYAVTTTTTTTVTKRKNNVVREEFDIVQGEGNNSGKVVSTCKNCRLVVQTSNVVNVSKLSDHLTMRCPGLPETRKELIFGSSQKSRRIEGASNILLTSTDGLLQKIISKKFGQTITIDDGDGEGEGRNTSSTVTTTTTSSSSSSMSSLHTAADMQSFLRPFVESSLALFESMDRFDDPFTQSALANFNSGLSPRDISRRIALGTLTPMIDVDIQSKIESLNNTIQGFANYAIDRVLIGGLVHVLTTRVVGCLRTFVNVMPVDTSSLANSVVPNIELDKWMAAMKADQEELKSKRLISSFTTNEGFLIQKCKELMDPNDTYIVARDWSASVEATGLSLMKTSLLQNVIKDAVTFIDLLNEDFIRKIKIDSLFQGNMMPLHKAQHPVVSFDSVSEACSSLDCLLHHENFLVHIKENEQFLQYYSKANKDRKNQLNPLVSEVSSLFSRFKLVSNILHLFQKLSHIMVQRNCPMSAYLPACVALYNEVRKVLVCFGNEEHIDESMSVLKACFNFSGTKPSEHVGMLEPYHMWMFLCDPFSRRLNFDVDSLVSNSSSGMSRIKSDMVAWSTSKSSDSALADQMGLEFNSFYTGTGTFMGKFAEAAEAIWDRPVLNDSITLDEVAEWVQSTGGHEARLAWFMVNAKHSKFYRHFALPLLSICVSGVKVINRLAPQLDKSPHMISPTTSHFEREALERQIRTGLNIRFYNDAISVTTDV